MRPRLFLLAPRVVFRAQINQAEFSYPLAEVAFDNVTVGSYEQVIYGQTAVFSTSIGAADLGRQRVRKPPTSDTFYFGRSSRGTHDGEVDLRDDAWIEVWDDYRIWPRIPAMPVAGGQDLTTYKDHEIPVGVYTTTPPPVANIGPGYAGTIDAQTGRITVEFDASHSWAVADGATITGYQWFVEDGTITDGAATDPQITATFPPGFRWVALTVTDSGGLTHTARCPVYARDPGADTSIEAFEITRHRITPQGQELALRVLEDIPASTYPDGTLVVLWDDDAVTPGRGHMGFCGWHHTDPAQISAQRLGIQRDVVFECVDVAGKLDTLPGFPQVLYADSLRDPQTHPQITWEYMVNPTVRKYIHYLLHWHSTALDLADFRFRGSTAGDDYPFLVLESGGASLYDQVASRAQALTPDHVLTCTRRGELAVWPDPMLVDPIDRTEASQGQILEEDWTDFRYTHQRHPTVYWLRAGAILSQSSPTYNEDGSLNIPTVFCVAPGEAPGTGEIAQEENERLALSQEALNRTIGHKYARLNAPQSHFQIMLADSDDRGLEPANLEWVWVGLSAQTAAQRGLSFLTMAGTIPVAWERGLVHSIDIRYLSQRTGLLRTITVEWEREVSGPPAVPVIPPVAEPADTYDPFPYVPPEPEPEPWYLAGGVNPATVIAAYEPYTAANLAESYTNIANPGTYTLTEGTFGGPSLAAGWVFHGFSVDHEYLRTGIVPVRGMSAVVAFDGCPPGKNQAALGVTTGQGVHFYSFDIAPRAGVPLGTKHEYKAGAVGAQLANGIANGVMGIAGQQGYLNGAPDGGPLPTADDAPLLHEIHIGAGNQLDVSGYSAFEGVITHVAFYTTTLTEAQMLAIYNAIQAELNA